MKTFVILTNNKHRIADKYNFLMRDLGWVVDSWRCRSSRDPITHGEYIRLKVKKQL